MDSLFLNKVAGGALLAILIGFVITEISGVLVNPTVPMKVAYPTPEIAAKPAAGGAAVVKTFDVPAIMAAANIDTGKKVWKKCGACHINTKGGGNKVGPNLYGVLNRDVASISDFKYSTAMKAKGAKGGKWTYHELVNFVHHPKKWVPKTAMGFGGLKKESQMGGIVLYLRSFGDADTPLPAAQ